ncbi:hypothetical protein NC99_21050 [Sunxiuqinia dokdonensis]|uniref:Uncharacterized protein n=2 Tax=Sunxiuqinia dokdonensis TaxID=1409788 RepID=A0A0L8V913_9BACT|nr:hypothetical protein NC99_21050 [Sunxiuqinia dokdonensis]
MHDAVIAFLDGKPEKWSSIPKIVVFKTELSTVNLAIEQSQESQLAAQVFVGESKQQLKKTIALKGDVLNDSVEAFAVVTDDAALESKMAASYSDLNEMRNGDFIPKIKEVITEVETHKEVLVAEYGVTEEQIEDLKADLNRFLEMNGEPRAYQIASTQATKSLAELFSEAHDILTTKLDKVMKIFKRRDPEFYNGYLAARVVVDR